MELNQSPELSQLAQKASVDEKETVPFMEPGQKVKRPRGRPKKSNVENPVDKSTPTASPQAPPAQAHIPTIQLVRPFTAIVSKGAVAYAGTPQVAMSVEEAEAIAQAMSLVIDKYLPDMMSKYGPEAMLVMALGAYGARVYATKVRVDDAKRKLEAAKISPEIEKNPLESLQFKMPTENITEGVGDVG